MTRRQLSGDFERDTVTRMSGDSFDIWYYLAILRRRWWLVLSTTLVALGMAWWSQRGRLPSYTAEALLQQVADEASSSPWTLYYARELGSHLDIIRSAEVLSPVVDSLGLQFRLKNYKDRRSQVLSRFRAERAVRQASYRLDVRSTEIRLLPGRGDRVLAEGSVGESLEGPGFSLIVADAGSIEEPIEFSVSNYDVALETLKRRLRIEQGTGPNLLWVRYTDADPVHAAEVVNSVSRSYQLYRAGSAREAAGRRRRFISEQLAQMADSLRTAQQGVIDYLANTLYDPNTEGSAVVSELLGTDTRIRELSYQERLLSGLVAGLQTSGENDQALQQVMALGNELVPQGPELSRRLQELQLRRAELTASRFGLTAEDPQVQVVDSLIAETKGQARLAAEQALQLLRNRIGQERSRYGQLSGQAGTLPVRSAEYQRLQQRVDAVQGVFDQLVSRYFEAQIAEGVEVGDIDIVSAAAVPVWPDASYASLNLMIGMIAGLLVGFVGAILVDQADSRIRRPQDAQRATNLEVVGTIPNIRSLDGTSAWAQLGKEAFRTLRTHLRFSQDGAQPRLIAVTSATPRDGKSTVAANLALTLADQGMSTLLLDADLRRPQVHTTFGLEQAPGLSDILFGEATLEEAVRGSSEHSSLQVLTCGSGVENPTEFIGGPEFEEFVHQLREKYEYVVLDTPPLLAVTDAALVGAVADGTLIVVRANRTDLGALRAAVSQLRRLGVSLLGLVINGVPTGRTSGYYYYASHYPSYAADGKEPADRKKRPLLRSGSGKRAG